jgi:hypothetical protein
MLNGINSRAERGLNAIGPCAWAVTLRPIMCAASTIATSSSSKNCFDMPAAVFERTPPIAVILM